MLKIELRRAPEGECPDCRGTGIVVPKKGETDLGGFCRNCKAGNERWEATLKILNGVEPERAKAKGTPVLT